MSITAASSSKTIIAFSPNGVSGEPAANAFLINFSVKYHLPQWKGITSNQLPANRRLDNFFPWFSIRYARVFITNDNKLIGFAYPEQTHTFQTIDIEKSGNFLFKLLLASSQIEYIERFRSGGDIMFNLDIVGEYDDGFNPYMGARETVAFNVNQKEWTNALKSAKHSSYILYEAQIPSELKEQFKPVLDFFEQAKKQLYYGEYDEVVAKCRMAIDSFIELSSIKSDLDGAKRAYSSGEERKAMTKDQRFLAYLESIRHFTHIAHHTNNGQPVSCSRSEALCMLGATAGAISALSNKWDSVRQ